MLLTKVHIESAHCAIELQISTHLSYIITEVCLNSQRDCTICGLNMHFCFVSLKWVYLILCVIFRTVLTLLHSLYCIMKVSTDIIVSR